MVKKILQLIRKITPTFVLRIYHFIIAFVSIIKYGNASKSMIVIGVTGTKGKSTTSLYLYKALSSCGAKVGLLSTVEHRIGDKLITNKKHMTMQGRGFVHKMLRKMKDAGCKYVVIETPSEGIYQYRNLGVQYDSLIFTNLSPEHLVTHKTYERYRAVKASLFSDHALAKVKRINGKAVKRFVIVNSDDPESEYFLNKAISKNSIPILIGINKIATHPFKLKESKWGVRFSFDDYTFSLIQPGVISARNAAPAIFLAKEYCNAESVVIDKSLSKFSIPGRMQEVNEGQDFKVFCDYAHEPLSIKSVYKALEGYRYNKNNKVIMIVGGVGDGRWKYNALDIGRVSGKYADITIITDVDPFFDDPKEIANEVLKGVVENKAAKYHIELNRRLAIRYAFENAVKGDVVIVTGKGSETTTISNGETLNWSDVSVIKKELNKI